MQLPNAGVWYLYWRDPYHLLLTVSWSGFLLFIVLTYAAINAIFALVYLTDGEGIASAHAGSFGDAFFLSVQTLASIGYGNLYPQIYPQTFFTNFYQLPIFTNAVVTFEALIELLGFAVVTRLAFTCFSQSTARVLFSRFAVVTYYSSTRVH
ncbi:hypothetical protein [Leptothermofonsia sp. ETS-13]|uniref:hypothetical protein n=1 Tax=Leptothermofonsia sp. ETS-13 TaxID=3035696 RepID=UPI003BA31747